MEKKYTKAIPVSANVRVSKKGNPYLNMRMLKLDRDTVKLLLDKCPEAFTWVAPCTLIEKLNERNIPTLERLAGNEVKQASPTTVLEVETFGNHAVDIVETEQGGTFINEPKFGVKVFDNREDTF